MELQFKSSGKRRTLGEVETLDDVYAEIQKFIDNANANKAEGERKFEWHYTRMYYAKEYGETIFDVGSHTEFFVVKGNIMPKN